MRTYLFQHTADGDDRRGNDDEVSVLDDVFRRLSKLLDGAGFDGALCHLPIAVVADDGGV